MTVAVRGWLSLDSGGGSCCGQGDCNEGCDVEQH